MCILKKMKKKCIYLDQFAISEMVMPDITPVWLEIKNQLIELHELGIIYCPLSAEHFMETAKKDFEDAQEHDLFLNKLSDNYCFKSEAFISSQLLSSKARGNNITLKTYMYDNVKQIFKSKDNHAFFEKKNQELYEVIEDKSKDLNTIRNYSTGEKLTPENKETFLRALKYLEAKKLIDRLTYLYENENIILEGFQSKDSEILNWTDLVINILLKKHKIKRKEVLKLIFELKSNGFKNIPSLDIRTTISSLVAIYGKKESSNDQIDISRISVALPISNILLTDKKRKYEILETKLDKKYKTKIYSGTKSDLNDFIKELKKLHTAQAPNS